MDANIADGRASPPGPNPDFEVFYRYHVKGVATFCALQRLSPHDACDVVSETFLRALMSRDRYDRQVAEPQTWLCGIARNVIFERSRARSRRDDLSLRLLGEPIAPSPQDVADYMALKERATQVLEALARLPEADRDRVLARELSGVAYSDLAAEERTTSQTVRKRISRTKARLRRSLQESM